MNAIDQRQSIEPRDDTRPREAHARDFDFSAPFFDSRTAQAYVGNKSRNAWYVWRKAHGIVAFRNGKVSKRDLERALTEPRAARRMAQASLDNLRVGRK